MRHLRKSPMKSGAYMRLPIGSDGEYLAVGDHVAAYDRLTNSAYTAEVFAVSHDHVFVRSVLTNGWPVWVEAASVCHVRRG